MSWLRRLSLVLVLMLSFAGAAHADRRWFVQSYTPYLATEGSLDLETHTIAAYGLGDSANTAFGTRIEFEYGITDRLTGAAYLNFIQSSEAESSMRFDGPSLEFIYRLTPAGKSPIDAAGYLEVRENGDELELEPKLLLAKRWYQLVGVVNVNGEFEHLFTGDEKGETEKNLRITAGLTREFGKTVAIGLEGYWDRPGLGEDESLGAFYVGPTINLQTPKVQIALGWQQQVAGTPDTGAGLNLASFPRSDVRLIVGISL